MQMKEYLIDTFQYNDITNRKLLEKIKLLPDKEESINFFSHLITCQYNWMQRMTMGNNVPDLDWWNPLYPLENLEEEWNKSLKLWINYIQSKTEDELSIEVIFKGNDGCTYAVTPKDIALQLNYHSIHHRAQIQTIISKQGIKADFVDYIGTHYRKVS